MTLLHYYLPPTIIRCFWSTFSSSMWNWHWFDCQDPSWFPHLLRAAPVSSPPISPPSLPPFPFLFSRLVPAGFRCLMLVGKPVLLIWQQTGTTVYHDAGPAGPCANKKTQCKRLPSLHSEHCDSPDESRSEEDPASRMQIRNAELVPSQKSRLQIQKLSLRYPYISLPGSKRYPYISLSRNPCHP